MDTLLQKILARIVEWNGSTNHEVIEELAWACANDEELMEWFTELVKREREEIISEKGV